MSTAPVRFETDFVAPWLVWLAADLGREPGVRIAPLGAGARDAHGRAGTPHVLRVQRASLVGPAVTVLTPSRPRPSAGEEAVRLGASDLAWRGPGRTEPWLLRSGPLPRLVCGAPDRSRSWALVSDDVGSHREAIESFAADHRLQLHAIAGLGGAPAWCSVRWLAGPAGLASLLGKMSIVFAHPGPLAWDAERAGALVVDPSPYVEAALRATAMERLAHVVPYPLVRDHAFWRGLIADLRSDRCVDWGTVAWVARARELAMTQPERSSSAPSLRRVQRKLRKLRRDPAAFFADSRWSSWRRLHAAWVARRRPDAAESTRGSSGDHEGERATGRRG